MISSVQSEALKILGELLALSPDIRLGQLLAHLGFLGEIHIGQGLGDLNDDEILAVMYRHQAELIARQQGIEKAIPSTSATVSVSGSMITA